MKISTLMDVICTAFIVQGVLYELGYGLNDPAWWIFTLAGTWVLVRCFRG